MTDVQTSSSNEDDLRRIFSNFGTVQTCIVNVDKRHAFVKMINRKDALAAREGMERYKAPDMQLRVRRIVAPYPPTGNGEMADISRHGGVLDSVRAIAATIRPASASSQSTD